jgi:hypothetical protein
MKLISQNSLTGFGGIGEGMSLQEAKGGRRIMWLAHEGAPENFTGVDVTDLKNPKVTCQTELPHKQMRYHSCCLPNVRTRWDGRPRARYGTRRD